MGVALILRTAVLTIPLAGVAVCGQAGLNGEWVGWMFCAGFGALEIFIISMMFYEQSQQFLSSLVKINALDLTFTRDLPEGPDGRWSSTAEVGAGFEWHNRHRN